MEIQKRYLQMLQSIFSKYPYVFYAFGSRVKGMAKKYSDLDLCYKEKIPDSVICQIEEELEESDLPFKVEMISWQRCTKEFQQLISKDLELFSDLHPRKV